jgi:hypothetical protein
MAIKKTPACISGNKNCNSNKRLADHIQSRISSFISNPFKFPNSNYGRKNFDIGLYNKAIDPEVIPIVIETILSTTFQAIVKYPNKRIFL